MPVPFKIEGEEFEKYEFSLDSNDTVLLPLELDVSNEIHDITIIAFPEPYREIDSAETALHLQDLICLRFQTMNSEPETKAENMQPFLQKITPNLISWKSISHKNNPSIKLFLL
ncbi:hypothetical protein [Alteribacter populi]|uniref:hypothetical protein n=1 Tax=Alteribacter populi TaxID=2011011 RepID=UPI0012FFB191|nr:hypothetical protein [Alteribacter populi]